MRERWAGAQEQEENRGAVVLDLTRRLPPRAPVSEPWLLRLMRFCRAQLRWCLPLMVGCLLGGALRPWLIPPYGAEAAARVLGIVTSGPGLMAQVSSEGLRLRLQGPSRARVAAALSLPLGSARAVAEALELDAGPIVLPESASVLDYAGLADEGVSEGELRSAELWLAEQVAHSPCPPALQHGLAVLLAMKGDPTSLAYAQALLTSVLTHDGGGQGVMGDLSVVLGLQQRLLESLVLAQRGLQGDPRNPILLYDVLQLLPRVRAQGLDVALAQSTGRRLDEDELLYRFLRHEPGRAWRRELEQRYWARLVAERGAGRLSWWTAGPDGAGPDGTGPDGADTLPAAGVGVESEPTARAILLQGETGER